MMKNVKELYQDRVSGQVTIEYDDDSVYTYNIKDTVTAETNPVTGGIDILSGGLPLEIRRNGGLIDYREFGSWLLPGQDIGANWQNAINQLPSGACISFAPGDYYFSAGAVSRKRIGVVGSGMASHFHFVPTVAKDTWLTVDSINAQSAEVIDDLQMDGLILRDFKMISDRSIRARALRLRRVDNFDLDNVFVLGFAGSSLQLDNCREGSITKFRSRYCGYMDSTNPHLSDPDWLWQSPPNFLQAITADVVGSASPQTVPITSNLYYDEDGVVLGLTVGVTVTVGDGTANRELVTITAMTSTSITGIFTKNHATGDTLTLWGDTTNLVTCTDVKLIYPFWDGLQINNAPANTINGILVHMIPAGNTTNGALLEATMIKMFGGTKGFTGGVPNNIFAALHKPVTGNEANCSALGFDPMTFMWASAISGYRARNTRIAAGNLIGGATNYVVRWEGNGPAANLSLAPSEINGDLYLTNVDAAGANTDITDLVGAFGQVGGTITVDPTTDIITIGSSKFPPPPTGYPVYFRNTTDANLPGGLSGGGVPMYSIRLSATTFKVAKTKELALAGTAVDITSTGTGTHYMLPYAGGVLAALAGSHIYVDLTDRLDNARQAFVRDSWAGTPYGSSVFGVPRIGSAMSQQQVAKLTIAAGNSNASFAGVQLGITGEKWYSPTGTQINA